MVAGDVILWEQFELQDLGGEDKDRWFVYMGDTGVMDCSHFYFLITATTRLEHYEQDGYRHRRKVVYFEPNPESPFADRCVLDVECDRKDIAEPALISCAGRIKIMGRISNEKIKEIWGIIVDSPKVPKMIKRDIRESISRAGIRI